MAEGGRNIFPFEGGTLDRRNSDVGPIGGGGDGGDDHKTAATSGHRRRRRQRRPGTNESEKLRLSILPS